MIRILLADDQKSIREILRVRLEAEADFEIVGTASDGHTAIELAEILHPDIVLLDMEMPGMGGVEVTRLICQALPDVKVLVLSAHNDDQYINQAIHAGAMGYLLKNTPSHELREAIRFVHRGYSQLGPGVLNKIVSPESADRQATPRDVKLNDPTVHHFADAALASATNMSSTIELEGGTFISSSMGGIEETGDSFGWGIDITGIIRRRGLPILATFSTAMAAIVVHTFFLEEPTYVSKLWIQVSNPRSVSVASIPEEEIGEIEKDVSKGRSTEVQILQSSPLIVDAMALLPAAYQSELKLQDVKDNLTVSQGEEDGILSNVLIAEYTDSDPKRTQAVLEVLGKAAIRYNSASTKARATSTIKFIEETLPSTRKTLNQATAAVRNFRKQYGMVNPDTYAEDLNKTKLSLANEIRTAEIILNQAESKVKSQQQRLQSLGQNPISAPLSAVLGQDDGYQSLARQLRDIQIQLNLQQANLGAEHPTIQNLKEQQTKLLDLTQQRAKGLLGTAAVPDTTYSGTIASNPVGGASSPGQGSADANSVLTDLSAQLLQAQTDLETQRTNLNSLRQAQLTVDKRFQQLPRLQENYGELQRQVTLHSSRLERLLQKLQELKIAAAQETSPWTILEPPELPKRPISPNILRNLVFGSAFGVILGFLIAFLLEKFDRRVTSLKEAKTVTALPLLGSIPHLILQPQKQSENPESPYPIYDCHSFQEAFRSLALRLRTLGTDHDLKTIAITSARAREGKSTVTYELGLTLAKLNLKVLLIDADMYHPTLHIHGHLENDRGLSLLLSEQQPWQEFIQCTGEPNLSILAAGSRPEDSLALLQSDKMHRLLEDCRRGYDYVLIDTPPVTEAVDTQGIIQHVDGTVFVLGLERATTPTVGQALGLLKASRNRLIGLVVNTVGERPKALAGHKSRALTEQTSSVLS
jgi:polysaccharide biosynthesis transport protein